MEGIDLVYTWCDSADPVWNARRLATMEAFDLVPDPAANAAARRDLAAVTALLGSGDDSIERIVRNLV